MLGELLVLGLWWPSVGRSWFAERAEPRAWGQQQKLSDSPSTVRPWVSVSQEEYGDVAGAGNWLDQPFPDRHLPDLSPGAPQSSGLMTNNHFYLCLIWVSE